MMSTQYWRKLNGRLTHDWTWTSGVLLGKKRDRHYSVIKGDVNDKVRLVEGVATVLNRWRIIHVTYVVCYCIETIARYKFEKSILHIHPTQWTCTNTSRASISRDYLRELTLESEIQVKFKLYLKLLSSQNSQEQFRMGVNIYLVNLCTNSASVCSETTLYSYKIAANINEYVFTKVWFFKIKFKKY